jgi:predicted ATP-binding protein involved in virulence
MKLSKLEITNFRCFESLSLDLEPDVNVFVGANGAGKTSILDAIAIALYEVVAANGGGRKRERAQQRTALQPTDILVGEETTDALIARREFVQFRATATDLYPVKGFPTATPSGKAMFLEWTDYITYQPPAKFIYDTRASERLSPVYKYFEAIWQEIRRSGREARIPLPVVAYYRAHRRIGKMPDLGDVFSLQLAREEAFIQALDAGTDFRAMCQWFYLRENAELRSRIGERQDTVEFPDLRAIRQALTSSLEGVSRVFFDGTPPRLKVRFAESKGGPRDLELAQLSDGYRNVLALVLDFARRLALAHPTWPQPLEAPGILLIDEVELHLHPRWQQAVIPSLRSAFPNTQLIVATHSPEILTTVKREHVRLLATDHSFESLADDVGTYGAESSRVLAEVFGAHSRPPMIGSVDKLKRYLVLIEGRQGDSQSARLLRAELDSTLGASDPDLQRADMRIAQLRALDKR